MAIADVAKVDAILKADIANINGLTVPSAEAFLLDTYTGAAAGYSTRRLASATTVLLRVRRDTGTGGAEDDDEADVAYDSNNELSLDSAISNTSAGVTATTLGQFLNVGTVNGTTYTNPDSLTVTASCFVDTWYDQAGSNDAEQTTQGRQPQIHDGTVNTDLITENGKPALDFDGSNILVSSTTETANNEVTAFIVANPTTTGTAGGQDTFGQYFGPAEPYDIWALEFYPGSELSASYSDGNFWSGSNSEHTYTQNNQLLFLAVYQTSNIIHSFDGSAITGSRSGSFNTQASPYFIGSWPNSIGAGNSFTGTLQEAVLWSSDQSSPTNNRPGIEGNVNAHFQIYSLLETYTGASVAFSVRQLSWSYAGSAMRVREAGGDTETDIGFDGSGNLDTAAIASHCGSNDGFVVTWYDQSGNGNDAEQPTAGGSGLQPKIYNGTTQAVITENGKPALDFDGSNDYMITTSTITVNSTRSDFGVFALNRNTGGGQGLCSTDGIDGGSRLAQNLRTNTTTAPTSQVAQTIGFPVKVVTGTTGLNTSTQYLMTATQSTSTLTVYLDGTSENSASHTNTTGTSKIGLGVSSGVSGKLEGVLQEIVMYNSDQDAAGNRTGIETNIDDYYQIPGM